MPPAPYLIFRLVEILAKPIPCDCGDECTHAEVRDIAGSLLTTLVTNLELIKPETVCTCAENPDQCAHQALIRFHDSIVSLVARVNTASSEIRPPLPRVLQPTTPSLSVSPRESLERYLDQRLITKWDPIAPPTKRSTRSPSVPPKRLSIQHSVVIADTPPQQPITPSTPVSESGSSTADAMAQPEPQAHSSRFDFTIMDTQHIVPEPNTHKYVGWSYEAALAGVSEYVTLPTLLYTFKQIRKRSFHIKAQRDEVIALLDDMTTVHPPASDRRFPPNTVLVNISNGVIADLIDKLRSALDIGERYIQDAQHDTKRLGSIDDAKLTFHKVVQRINSIPRSAPPDQLAVYGIYTALSFETKYQLTWEQ